MMARLPAVGRRVSAGNRVAATARPVGRTDGERQTPPAGSLPKLPKALRYIEMSLLLHFYRLILPSIKLGIILPSIRVHPTAPASWRALDVKVEFVITAQR